MKVALGFAVALSVLMSWEAFFPSAFTVAFHRPLRDWLETAYFFPLAVSLIVLVVAVYRAVRSEESLTVRALRLLLAAFWCVAVFFCALAMGVRALI
jgi:hypothetical protein